MKLAIRNSRELCDALELEHESLHLSSEGEAEFPVFVPRELLSRIRVGDPNDPILLQVLPRSEESQIAVGDLLDPVGDSLVEKTAGLLHKYSGRVLLIVSGACAVHCRYCFRRHYPYSLSPKSLADWQPAIEYIQSDDSIHEIILSGGDPLTVSDGQLSNLIKQLDAIPHLSRLRIHTRLPVVIPNRVDASLCEWLRRSRLAKWIVLHINHAQEIDSEVLQAIQRLQQTGAVVLNQSVLLRGVNDCVDTLHQLCEQLIDCGVVPYYLHQLDRVRGASHFEVDEALGRKWVESLVARLPGYAVPKYVREISGEPNKTAIELRRNSTSN